MGRYGGSSEGKGKKMIRLVGDPKAFVCGARGAGGNKGREGVGQEGDDKLRSKR